MTGVCSLISKASCSLETHITKSGRGILTSSHFISFFFYRETVVMLCLKGLIENDPPLQHLTLMFLVQFSHM